MWFFGSLPFLLALWVAYGLFSGTDHLKRRAKLLMMIGR